MNLSSDLISQFVKITKDTTKEKKETNTYGHVVKIEGEPLRVRLIGASEGTLTPVRDSEVDVNDGDRVSLVIRDHSVKITGNLTSPAARSGTIYTSVEKLSVDYGEFKTLVADELKATNAKIESLDVSHLEADLGEFKTLVASDFEAINAKIDKLDVGTLDADMATIKTLIFGSASGDTIQTSFSNSVIAQLGDAQIKSAMIESISAAKITAGDIITNNVQVMSEDGRLLIYDETIQISDSSRMRVQIGLDDSGDYSINVWDADGNLMFSEGGITDNAIKKAIIRNDMVSDTANISATKLDIDSLFEEINDADGRVIKSAKILLDDEDQTLDVAFKSLATNVTEHGETITSHGTQITTIQGQITNKIWQQDIVTATNEFGAKTEELSTKYSELNQTVDGISTTVASHSTYMNDFGYRMSKVEQTADGLTIRLNGQKIGGTNILRGTDSPSSFSTSSNWSNGTWRTAGGGTAGGRTIIDISDAPNPYIKKGFEIVGDDTDRATAQDNVPVTQGVTYTMSCYARGTGTLRLQVGKSPYSAGVHTLNGVTDWTKYSFTFVAGDGNGITDGKTNVYFTNRGVGTMEICGFKLEVGTDSTDWSPSPHTDYLNYSSSGLIVGDMTTGTLKGNVLIDSDSVDIRNGNTVYASFGANYLYLGKNSRNAKIDLCNGLATLYHESKYSYDTVFVIDTGNVTEIIGSINPLCITNGASTGKVAMQFANKNGILGSIGMYSTGSNTWLTRNVPSSSSTYTVLDSGNYYDVMDSGWINGGLLGEYFTLYDNDYQVQYRKIGKMVELRGVVKPKKVIPGSDENHIIFTLASGYRPGKYIYERCQGSGAKTWLLSIATNGEVRFARYNDGTQYVDAPITAWLPFHITFFVD